MSAVPALHIGITCYPSIGGSGILASALGEALARRGHEVHFISYERPFRLPDALPGLHFHPVQVGTYDLFRYPDYTLPLSVKMAEVSRDHRLDVLHVHYAVPHATAAVLARSLLPDGHRPRLVTTLHGTDTTLLGHDPAYGPAIRHALEHSDAVTSVSDYLRRETQRVLAFERPIDVIHNFFDPRPPQRTREQVRSELGIGAETLILHASNLRPVKRIDVLLAAAARLRQTGTPFKLLILAGADFSPFAAEVKRLGLGDHLIVRERVVDIEDYFQAADLGLFTSAMESFGLSILEAMCFGCPSVATAVGGVPEVVESGTSGLLVPPGDVDALVTGLKTLIGNPRRRAALGEAARRRAGERFSARVIVPQYEALYRRVHRTPAVG
jgi:N-acetyl-alpha-D-glucosaminyl L-malate synthase BshA